MTLPTIEFSKAADNAGRGCVIFVNTSSDNPPTPFQYQERAENDREP